MKFYFSTHGEIISTIPSVKYDSKMYGYIEITQYWNIILLLIVLEYHII